MYVNYSDRQNVCAFEFTVITHHIQGLFKKYRDFMFNKYIKYVIHYLNISPLKYSPPDEMQWSRRSCNFLKVL